MVGPLQSLFGKLNWACQMVKGGRTFVRRLIDSSSEFFDDIAWCIKFMNMFNGTVKFLDLKPITCLQTDACLQSGAGYYEGDFFYVNCVR